MFIQNTKRLLLCCQTLTVAGFFYFYYYISIIAVSYEARAHGVTRNMWVDDAKKLCPDLQVARVRESHGKADLTQ